MAKKEVKIVSFTALEDGTEEVVINLAPAHKEPIEEIKKTAVTDERALLREQIIHKFGQISAASNDTSTKERYEGRNNYKKIINDYQDYSMDIWYEMPYYGKINAHGAISGLSKDTLGKGIAPYFIVRALDDFIKTYNYRRYLSKQSKFLRKLKIKKAWESIDEIRQTTILELYTDFFANYLTEMKYSEKIKNIDDFYKFLLYYMKDNNKKITWPGLMESQNNNPFISGLVYDFHDGNPHSDEEKLDFLEDENYEAFSYLAKEHGFKVDPNVPWRLIADLRSDKMWTYLAKYHLKESGDKPFASANLKKVFNEVFVPHASYENFLSQFVGIVIGMYNQFIEGYPTYQTLHLAQLKATRKTKVQVLPRKQYEEETLSLKWIAWYAEIRNAERGSPLSDKKLKMLIKNIKQITRHAVIKLETGYNEDYRKFSELAITHVEYSLGTIASVNKPIDRKDLTIHEKDVILLMNFS